ncbi:helix-turn-helix domain-containing protein [Treponema sp. OttesenSCG-928-L16]|nr:helix-turn-helix domain-containing protein [Treponema sp. OttesenSCG-928-L16]
MHTDYQEQSPLFQLAEILSRKQVAELLQIGLSTLDSKIPASSLPRIKIGKSVRYLRSDVENYIRKQRICGDNL